MDEVDSRLPSVAFRHRPLALKFTITLLIIGVAMCLGFIIFFYPSDGAGFLMFLFVYLFLIISVLGTLSIIFLLIPKKVGWYFAMVTAFLALPGLGIGTLIGIFTIFALMWPSNRYYFHTGLYPPQTAMAQSPIPPYPVDHVPHELRRSQGQNENTRTRSF
jgi:hypothetical protein